MKVILATLDAKYIHASLALRYLKKYCSSLEIEFVMKDYTINNGLLHILRDIYSYQPDVVAFACYIWNIEMTVSLIDLIKKVCPNVTIILGGPEVTYEYVQLIKEHEAIDYIVLGEGEQAFYELLKCLQQGLEVNVQGVALRKDEKVLSLGGPQIIAELDKIPFPYSDEEMTELKDKIIYYESSRGCPFSCQYCLSSATQGVRYFNLHRVKQDLQFFIRHNVKQVKFVDRTFNACKQHFLPILQFLAVQDCQTNFHFEITAELLDDEVFQVLRSAPKGRFQFEIGIQSTYDKTLRQIGRKNNWSKIVKHVQTIQNYENIHLHLDLIVGLPDEDWKHFARSFNDVYALKPNMLQIGFLKLLKGSTMRKKAQQLGYIYMDQAPYEVLASNVLSYGQIRKMQLFEDVFNLYYNSGKFIFTLGWLEKNLEVSAFEMYCRLTNFWEEKEYHKMAHTTKALYGYLLEFCEEQQGKEALCDQFLRFDYLVNKSGVKPELNWNEQQYANEVTGFWRREEIVKKYIPEFKFSTWRELNRKYHIEVFNTNIIEYIKAHEALHTKLTPILFIHEKEQSRYVTIESSDFLI